MLHRVTPGASKPQGRWSFFLARLKAMARGASGAMALSMQFLAQSRPAQVLVACVELQPCAATCRVRPWGVQEINWAQGHHSRMEAARQKNTAGTRSNSTPCSFYNARPTTRLIR